ncbi:MAG: Ig-like domain-containing protein [Caldilineaceae bacterium]
MKRITLTTMLLLGLLLSVRPAPTLAETLPQAGDPATVAPANVDAGDPAACIDPLKAAHIAATVASVLPIPIFSNVADLSEYILNIALKNCSAVLTPPPPVVIDPAITPDLDTDPCTQHLRLPLSDEDTELITLDRQIIQAVMDEVESDPRVDIPLTFLRALRDELESTYGRFESEKQGEYTNIYGIVFSSASHGADWGDFGAPTIYHYNSDVRVQMQHGGARISDDYVRFRTGNYSVRWHGETLISGLDFVYIPGGFENPGTEKAAREAAKETVRESVKTAAREAVERGAREFAEKTAKETVQEFIKETAEEVAEQTLEEAILSMLDSYYSLGAPHGVFVDDSQTLRIIDHNAPTISGNTPVTVEALEPGGITASKHIDDLRDALVVSDDCDPTPELTYNTPRFWPLGETSEIIWTARDNGAAGPDGGRNATQATQQVTVVDTMPPILVAPPPVVMEGTGVVDVPLGRPQVFDVADLRPTISSDAPAQFTPGVYDVTWRATDSSGNVSAVTGDSVQIVNIKAPGTNVLPTAVAQTGANAVAAIADEPVKITLRGQDGNNPPDPLWFAIDDQPEHGYFIAPLYPYFIDDYRMTARYSPQIAQQEGEEFAWQVAQSQQAMREYIIQLCEEDIRREDLPKDFVSWNGGSNKYVAVDDAGFTYIYDSAYRKCTPGGSTVAPYTTPRISVWDEHGLYVGELERTSDSRPLRDIKFNVGRGTIIAVSSDGSSTGNSLVEIAAIQPQNAAEPIVSVQTYSLWNEINDVFVGADNTARGPEYKNAGAAAWDTNANVLYVIGDANQNLKGMAAFRPAECNNTTGRGPDDCLDLLGVPVYSYAIVQSTKWNDFPGVGVDAMKLRRIRDITVDSAGNVYILAEPDDNPSGFDRIYKFAAATVNPDGTVALGELIGWLGRCEDGPNCNYIDQHSIGFSCTDATCTVTGDTGGSGPGQLDGAAAIAMDPNDVLYVADSGNSRVQRFNADGLFAGEARSTGDGTGFVLGDFGRPGNIAVNSGSFYIIDVDTELVHVFDAAVVHGIDAASAWVEYRSDSNFVGQDRFTFTATDGFRTGDGEQLTSPPADVEINVARNFRPPDAANDLSAVTDEDTPVAITLAGNDLDGDGLTFEVTQPPVYGTLSGASPTVTYTPDPNYAGNDAFAFVAVDDSGDADNRSAPEAVAITINPVNDTPAVSFGAVEVRGGVGYPFTLDAVAFDPDRDDSHTVTVDWGDGTVENQGEVRNDGTFSGPVLVAGAPGESRVNGYHTYTSQGVYTIEVCVTDAVGATGCGQQTAVIVPMVDLAVARTGPQVVGEGATTLAYALSVTNRASESGGITAADVVLRRRHDGLRFGGVSDGDTCSTSGATLTCAVGTLAPDTAFAVDVTVEFVGACRRDDDHQHGLRHPAR